MLKIHENKFQQLFTCRHSLVFVATSNHHDTKATDSETCTPPFVGEVSGHFCLHKTTKTPVMISFTFLSMSDSTRNTTINNMEEYRLLLEAKG